VTKVDRLEEAENLRISEKKETEYKPVVMESQPQLMLTGPAGFAGSAAGFNHVGANSSTATPVPGASAPGTYTIPGQMPSYQGYSM